MQAKPVTPIAAKNLALSFYKQRADMIPQTLTLAYTETSASGEALYYVFNVNTNEGFVIITADDAAHPIIGYSTEKAYVIPEAGSSSKYWMQTRKKEIISIKSIVNAPSYKATHTQEDEIISREWAGDFSGSTNSQKTNGLNSVNTATVAALVKSTWNQSPYYNAYCPGSTGNGTGSKAAVTGCVATTMAQIMRYWSYPAKGTGSSTYTQSSNPNNYPAQTANYGATTYNWSGMPLNDASITSTVSTFSAVATLMYQAGVSVEMSYSPSGSGAFVLAADVANGGACAQKSYVTYFGYNATTIKGYQRTHGNYNDAAWLALIETDLNAGRPVQYAGQDPSDGGHTWVCDGYDASGNVHMNWGWAGSDDGFFSINNLLTTNGGFNPSTNHEILVGIQPPASVDAGIAAIVSPAGVACSATFIPVVSLENFGTNTLTSCTISYQIDAGTAKTYSWTGSLATGQSINVSLPSIVVTSGTHTLTSSTSSPNNTTDANAANNQSSTTFMSSTIGVTLPLAEGFEASANLPTGWTINNPDGDAAWQVVTTVAHTGTNCIGFNNCDGDANTDMTGKKDWFYTTTYNFSSASTANMNFDVGYVPANDGTTTYSDTLVVLYSVDCGTSWTQLYKKGGMALATAPVFTISSTVNCNAPTSSQWRTEPIALPAAVIGKSNVEFAFENISDYGNWIYLDNINITATNGTTGISSNMNNEAISVYPNPAHNNLFVHVTENASSITVTNIIGQTVIAEQKVNANQEVQTLDITSLADGIYFVRVNATDTTPKIIRFIKN